MYIFSSTGYEFIQETANILNHTKYGLASTHWSGVSSSLTCASMVVNSCPGSRGYIFEPVSGLCTPLNWLHEGPSQNFGIPAGELYLTTDHLCPDPFKVNQGVGKFEHIESYKKQLQKKVLYASHKLLKVLSTDLDKACSYKY